MSQQFPEFSATQTPYMAIEQDDAQGTTGSDYEYMVLTCQPHESLGEVRRRVIDHAEYGKWELRRSRLYTGGLRKYWLRRRIIRVRRTL